MGHGQLVKTLITSHIVLSLNFAYLYIFSCISNKVNMRGSKKFCQRGSNFDNFFLKVDEGERGINQMPL